MLILLFVSPFKGAVYTNKGACAKGVKIFAILFENNLLLRASQQSVVKWARPFLQLMATPTVSNAGV